MKFIARLESTKSALAASVTSQLIAIFFQLLLVPLYLSEWDPVDYGYWIIIFSFAASIALLDFGVSTAASVRYQAAQCSKQFDLAAYWRIRAIQITLIGLALIIAAMLVGCLSAESTQLFALPTRLFFVAGLLGASIIIYNTLTNFLRVQGRNGFALWVGAITLLLENLLPAILVTTCDFGIEGAIAVLVSIRSASAAFLAAYEWKVSTDALGKTSINRALKHNPAWSEFVRDAVTAAAIPVAMALMLQVPVSILGTALGSTSAALYVAMRTMGRLVFQVAYSYPRVVMPKFAQAYFSGQSHELNFHLKRIRRCIWLVSLPGCLMMSVLGEPMFEAWTHGALGFDRRTFWVLTAVTFIHAYWYTTLSMLVAIGKHARVTLFVCASSVAYLLFLSVGAASLLQVALATLFAEMLIAIVVHTEQRGKLFVASGRT